MDSEKLIDALRTEASISLSDEARLLNAAADKIADQQAKIERMEKAIKTINFDFNEISNESLKIRRELEKQIADQQVEIKRLNIKLEAYDKEGDILLEKFGIDPSDKIDREDLKRMINYLLGIKTDQQKLIEQLIKVCKKVEWAGWDLALRNNICPACGEPLTSSREHHGTCLLKAVLIAAEKMKGE